MVYVRSSASVVVDRDHYNQFVELIRAHGDPIILAVYDGGLTIHIPCRAGEEPWELIESLLARHPEHSFGAVINPPLPCPADWGCSPEHWRTSLSEEERTALAAEWSALLETLSPDQRDLLPWDYHSTDIGRLVPDRLWRRLRKWGAQNDHIAEGLGVWLDFDAGDRHEQEAAVAEMGCWTVVNATGGKSLHPFRLLAPGQEVTPAQFKAAQKGLARQVTTAYPSLGVDSSISNAARIMRLPGARHPKSGRNAEVVECSGEHFPRTDLLALIADDERLEEISGIDIADAAPRRADELWLGQQPPARQIELLAAMLRFVPSRDEPGSGTYPPAFRVVASMVHAVGFAVTKAAILAATWSGVGKGAWTPADAIKVAAAITARDRPARIGRWLIDRAIAEGFVKPPDMPEGTPLRPGPLYQRDRGAELLEGSDPAAVIADTFAEAEQNGQFPLVLLSDPCGAQKTRHAHRTIEALLKLPHIDRVIFVSANYRNLPCEHLRQYPRVPSRYVALIEVQEGNEMAVRTLRRDQWGMDLRDCLVDSETCQFTWALGDAKQQGATINHARDFCQRCPNNAEPGESPSTAQCRFIRQRNVFLTRWQQGAIDRVACNIALLPFALATAAIREDPPTVIELDDGEFMEIEGDGVKKRTAVVVDEGDQVIEALQKKYFIPYERLNQWLEYFDLDGRFRNDDLARELVTQLRDLSETIEAKHRYGLDPHELQERFKDWLDRYRSVHPDGLPQHWDDIECEPIFSPAEVKRQGLDVEMTVRPPLLLPKLVRALAGISGSLSATRKRKGHDTPGLELTVPSRLLPHQLEKTAGIVVLDATNDYNALRQQLCGERPVLARDFRTVATDGFDRLQFVQIACLGGMTSDPERRDAQNERLRALVGHVEQGLGWQQALGGLPAGREPMVGVIAQPAHGVGNDLRWHVNHRGSNAVRTASALVLDGLPWVNKGTLLNEFRAQFPDGTQDQFDVYYRRQCGKELIQGIARIRPLDLQDGETVTVYLVTNADLSGMGLEIEQVRADEITWAAGNAHQRTVHRVAAAIDEHFSPGAVVTQREAGRLAGVPERTLRAALAELDMTWEQVLRLAPWRTYAADHPPTGRRPRGRPKQMSLEELLAWAAAQPICTRSAHADSADGDCHAQNPSAGTDLDGHRPGRRGADQRT